MVMRYVKVFRSLSKSALHTLIPTLPLKTNLQYLGLSLENAEFLAPLFSFQHLELRPLVGKVRIKGCNLSLHTYRGEVALFINIALPSRVMVQNPSGRGLLPSS